MLRHLWLQVQAGDWRKVLADITPPDANDDYNGWLAFQKKKWRIQRAERKRNRQLGVSLGTARARLQGNPVASSQGGIDRFLAEKRQALHSKHWQVLQVSTLVQNRTKRAHGLHVTTGGRDCLAWTLQALVSC